MLLPLPAAFFYSAAKKLRQCTLDPSRTTRRGSWHFGVDSYSLSTLRLLFLGAPPLRAMGSEVRRTWIAERCPSQRHEPPSRILHHRLV